MNLCDFLQAKLRNEFARGEFCDCSSCFSTDVNAFYRYGTTEIHRPPIQKKVIEIVPRGQLNYSARIAANSGVRWRHDLRPGAIEYCLRRGAPIPQIYVRQWMSIDWQSLPLSHFDCSPDERMRLGHCFVYVILAREHLRIKIGSSTAPDRRLKTLQCGSSTPLELIASVAGDISLERSIQARCAAYRVTGAGKEWFTFDAVKELIRPRNWPINQQIIEFVAEALPCAS